MIRSRSVPNEYPSSREHIARPLGHHDGDHDEEELVDVVGDLHHDHSERHRQAGDAAEEGDRPQQRERPGVHPRPVFVRLRRQRHCMAFLLMYYVEY